jgi:hypothetical protein
MAGRARKWWLIWKGLLALNEFSTMLYWIWINVICLHVVGLPLNLPIASTCTGKSPESVARLGHIRLQSRGSSHLVKSTGFTRFQTGQRTRSSSPPQRSRGHALWNLTKWVVLGCWRAMRDVLIAWQRNSQVHAFWIFWCCLQTLFSWSASCCLIVAISSTRHHRGEITNAILYIFVPIFHHLRYNACRLSL